MALYGLDFLIADKEQQRQSLEDRVMDEATIRLREELAEQIRALQELQTMAAAYGFDISRPNPIRRWRRWKRWRGAAIFSRM